jgi:hypothetical protein
MQDDPVSEELQRLGLWNEKLTGIKGDLTLPIKLPGKSLSFHINDALGSVDFKLTPQEYDRLIQYSAGVIPSPDKIPGPDAFSASVGEDPDMKGLGYKYHEFIERLRAESQSGTLPPLKESLRKVLLARPPMPEGLSGAEKEKFTIAQDNRVRYHVKYVINAYQNLGKAVLWMERDRLTSLVREVKGRADRWTPFEEDFQ